MKGMTNLCGILFARVSIDAVQSLNATKVLRTLSAEFSRKTLQSTKFLKNRFFKGSMPHWGEASLQGASSSMSWWTSTTGYSTWLMPFWRNPIKDRCKRSEYLILILMLKFTPAKEFLCFSNGYMNFFSEKKTCTVPGMCGCKMLLSWRFVG